ncbi:MAG TPA: hypothetical protein VN958_08500 [Chitinophagaceae bacterium]|nr:hypothetical protein [Chitinophagaceae bacterium]
MKTFILAITIIVFFTACTKDRPTSNYYVKATINGTDVEYSNYTAAIYKTVGLLYIYGFNSAAIDSDDGIHLIVYHNASGSDQPVIVGTYIDTANVFRSPSNIYWNPFTASMSLQQSGISYINMVSMDTTSLTPFTCNITGIDSSSVSGTFSGNVYFIGSNASIKITNGSFYVPF